MFNKAFLLGNLGRDPEIRSLPSGQPVANFPMATSRKWRDKSGQMQYVYQTTGLPESFLLDRNGVIQRRIAGGTIWDAEQHKKMIRRLLDGGSADR